MLIPAPTKSDQLFQFMNVRSVQLGSDVGMRRHFISFEPEKGELTEALFYGTHEDHKTRAIEVLNSSANGDFYVFLKKLIHVVEEEAAVQLEPGMKMSASFKQNLNALSPLSSQPTTDIYLSKFYEAHRPMLDRSWARYYAHILIPNHPTRGELALLMRGVRAFHYIHLLTEGLPRLSWAELNATMLLFPPELIPPALQASSASTKDAREAFIEQLGGVSKRIREIDDVINDLKTKEALFWSDIEQRILNGDFEKVIAADEAKMQGPSGKILHQFRLDFVKSLTDKTQTFLRGLLASPVGKGQIVLELIQLPRLYERLEQQKYQVEEFDFSLFEDALRRVGSRLPLPEISASMNTTRPFELVSRLRMPEHELAPRLTHKVDEGKPQLVQVKTPIERGIHVLGVGESYVVEQRLSHYAIGEMAHTEPLIAGESKLREHVRSRETEVTIIREEEIQEESQKDLQSTERFEMKTETQKSEKEQLKVDASLKVSAKYGTVKVEASGGFSLMRDTSEETRKASQYAKEITSKASSSLSKKERKVLTRRTLERFEEKNKHELKNDMAGAKDKTSLYFWIDKYYEIEMFSVGRRLMLEFSVPQPAFFYSFAAKKGGQKNVTASLGEEPTAPVNANGDPLQPKDITRWNFNELMARYDVIDDTISPLKPAVTTRAFQFQAKFEDEESTEKTPLQGKSDDTISIPVDYMGYVAEGECARVYRGSEKNSYYYVYIAGQLWSAKTFDTADYNVDDYPEAGMAGKSFGSAQVDRSKEQVSFGTVSIYGIEDQLPITILANQAAVTVALKVTCVLKREVIEAWQLKVYQAIMTAYRTKLMDYRERVAAAQIQQGVQIRGRNPEANREIEKRELKRGSLQLLTNHFEQIIVEGIPEENVKFDAVVEDAVTKVPQIDTDRAIKEAKIVKFFEQAFEWENMVYYLYDSNWAPMYQQLAVYQRPDDPDPQFTSFLNAGYAHTVVPVREAFVDAVLFYLTTNQIWLGGSPPGIGDPLYVSVIEELQAGKESRRFVKSWPEKLPTSLVCFVDDKDRLPEYPKRVEEPTDTTSADSAVEAAADSAGGDGGPSVPDDSAAAAGTASSSSSTSADAASSSASSSGSGTAPSSTSSSSAGATSSSASSSSSGTVSSSSSTSADAASSSASSSGSGTAPSSTSSSSAGATSSGAPSSGSGAAPPSTTTSAGSTISQPAGSGTVSATTTHSAPSKVLSLGSNVDALVKLAQRGSVLFGRPRVEYQEAEVPTLGDGNCGFNAFALVICDIVMHEGLPQTEYALGFYRAVLSVRAAAECNVSVDASVFKAFVAKLEVQRRQELLAPVLRVRAIELIESEYESVYKSEYETRLWAAYKAYQENNGDQDDTFCVHSHILGKFKEKGLNEEQLKTWWAEEGKSKYFNNLRDPAQQASELQKWAGEIELDALATAFQITVKRQIDQHNSQPLGYGCGRISVTNLSSEERLLLREFGIATPERGTFKLGDHLTRRSVLAQRLDPISGELQSHLEDHLTHQRIAWNRGEQREIEELEQRNILTRAGGATYRLIPPNDSTRDKEIDAERIRRQMDGLRKASAELAEKIEKAHQENTPVRYITHGGSHWSYLGTEQAVQARQQRLPMSQPPVVVQPRM